MFLLRLIAAAFLLASATAAEAADKVALLIGNGGYQHANPLPNPGHDATDFAAALKSAGFEVTVAIDLDLANMKAAIADFAGRARTSKIAVFYYAGHGVAVAGREYMVPVDAEIKAVAGVPAETVPLQDVLKDVASGTHATIVFYDSDRNNPFEGAEKALGPGAAEVMSCECYIGYATSPGSPALDGDGRNSPYAAALIKHMTAKGVELSQASKKVKRDVYDATKGGQIPWEHSSLKGEVYLGGQ